MSDNMYSLDSAGTQVAYSTMYIASCHQYSELMANYFEQLPEKKITSGDLECQNHLKYALFNFVKFYFFLFLYILSFVLYFWNTFILVFIFCFVLFYFTFVLLRIEFCHALYYEYGFPTLKSSKILPQNPSIQIKPFLSLRKQRSN